MENFEEILWWKSFKEGNFFYDLIELDKFNLNSFNELLKNVDDYRDIIYWNKNINKEIVKYLYISMNKFIQIINSTKQWNCKIKWIPKWKKLFDYYEELIDDIRSLFYTENNKNL